MKVASIEALRGFAVTIVIFFHLYLVQDRYFEENILPELFLLGGWGVDIFFVISGVVMYKSVYGRPGGNMTWPFLRARITRIYPPYWVITFLIFAIAQFRPSLVNSSYDETPSLVRSLLLFPDVTTPWLNVGWSLIYEMWFYLLLGSLLLVRKSMAIAVLGAYALFLLLAGGAQESGPVIRLITDPLILEFLFGFALGMAYFRHDLQRRKAILLAIATVPLLIIALRFAYGFDLWDSPLERVISFGLPAISIVALGLCLEDFVKRCSIFRPLIIIGNVSYSVYLTHVLFLNAFLFTGLRVLKLEIPVLTANVACVGFVIFAGSLYYQFIEKTTSKAFMQVLNRP